MSFNPELLETRLPALGGFAVVELAGTDAAAFAQAQFTSHVGALAPGHWHWSGWLTPKGRVIALFALLKFAEDRLWLILPDYPAVDFVAGLRRYVFRSKVAIEVRSDWQACAGVADAPGRRAAPDAIDGNCEQGCVLDFSGEGGARRLVLLPRGHLAVAEGSARIDADWRLQDLRHGLPRLGPTQAEAWTPHMLSLDRLNAFSVKKGCYPGQEIVARTHFLGQSKRGLVRLVGEAALPAGVEVRDLDDRRLGDVACSADADDAHECLAVLPLDAEIESVRVGTTVARPAPLLAGLAR